jgi:hypothetical protein
MADVAITSNKITEDFFNIIGEDCNLKCAHVFNSDVQRSSGLWQLNDVLKKDNHTQKGMSNELKKLESDIAELNQLLKQAVR